MEEMLKNNTEQAQNKLKNKTGAYIAVVGIVFMLSAAGAFGALYTQVWDPSWNPFALSPEELLADVYSNMAEINVFEMDAKGTVKTTQEGASIMDADVDLILNAEGIREDVTSVAGNMNGEIGYSGIDFNFDLDFIFKEHKIEQKADFYFKINEFPFLALIQAFAPEANTENLLNTWLYVNGEEQELDTNELAPRFLKDPKNNSYEIVHSGKEKLMGESMHKITISVPLEDLYAIEDGEENYLTDDVDIPEIVDVVLWIDGGEKQVRRAEYSFNSESRGDSASRIMPLFAQISEGTDFELYPQGDVVVEVSFIADFNYPAELDGRIEAPGEFVPLEDLNF